MYLTEQVVTAVSNFWKQYFVVSGLDQYPGGAGRLLLAHDFAPVGALRLVKKGITIFFESPFSNWTVTSLTCLLWLRQAKPVTVYDLGN